MSFTFCEGFDLQVDLCIVGAGGAGCGFFGVIRSKGVVFILEF